MFYKHNEFDILTSSYANERHNNVEAQYIIHDFSLNNGNDLFSIKCAYLTL